ncbi:hypothetical protein SAY86_027702 [Trapa natans]|uniref:Uncharacterized protein n=1 Tax=Trapa natans TaxID=22666 RepID=A0AAN7KV06_TRANT|nr:hypothetical protein SAY86_027702 [Trapa natans]
MLFSLVQTHIKDWISWRPQRFGGQEYAGSIWDAKVLLQHGLLPSIGNGKQNNRLQQPNKRNITPKVALPFQLQNISTLQILHVGIPECSSHLLGARVQNIKKILPFFKLLSEEPK